MRVTQNEAAASIFTMPKREPLEMGTKYTLVSFAEDFTPDGYPLLPEEGPAPELAYIGQDCTGRPAYFIRSGYTQGKSNDRIELYNEDKHRVGTGFIPCSLSTFMAYLRYLRNPTQELYNIAKVNRNAAYQNRRPKQVPLEEIDEG